MVLSRAARLPLSLVGLLLTLGMALPLSACDKKHSAKQAAGLCSAARRCPNPQICVRTPGVYAGHCVPPCQKDGQCPTGQRCTGRYRPDGTTKDRRYCKRATVPPGGDCTGLRDGCQPGYECHHGRTCVRTCKDDTQCSDEERCVAVPDQRVFGIPRKTRFRVCVKSTGKAGATCGPDRRPLCARGYFCRHYRCVKQCTEDSGCDTGWRCDGVFQEATRVGGALPPPRRYCRRAAAFGERCGRNNVRDVGCVQDHTCYRGRCRRICESNEDCPETGRRRLRCRTKRRHGESFRICL